MLEGEGDAFRFKLQSRTKVTHQTKNKKNHQLAEACSTKLTLEGEGDTFWFKSQSCTMVTHKTKNQRTVSLPMLAPPN
jgi:hypothetical protein